MLIIVVGESCTGKSYFIENCMSEIKGYDTKRRVKVYSAFQNELTSDEFLNLIVNHKQMSNLGKIDFDDIVIETCSVRYVSPNVINNANYVIFTDFNSMQKYFVNSTYGGYSSSIFKTMQQVNKFYTDKYSACIWDSWNKLFI